jgi:alanine racemase
MPPVSLPDSRRALSNVGTTSTAVPAHQANTATSPTTAAPDTREAARALLPAARGATGQRFDNNKLRAKLNAPAPPSKMTQLAIDLMADPTRKRADNVVDMALHADLVAQLDMNATRATLNRQNRAAQAEQESQLQAQLREAAGAIATVDLGAMRQNYRAGVARLGPNVTPTAVIKANGYGLGATKLAQVLIEEGCKDFFVARIGEAVDLRKSLRAKFPEMADKVAINVLDGNLAGADPQLLIDHRITPVLNSLQQVQEWNAAARERKTELPAILQFDSGMHRAGMPNEDLEALLADQKANMGSIKTQFIMTHLAKSDDATKRPDGSFQAGEATEQQLANFKAITARFPFVKASIGASSTVLLDPKFHMDYVRLGATFHAQDPIDGADNPYQQVLTLKSKIAQVRTVPAGGEIGYGGRFIATKPTDVATIPIGYADGPPRAPNANPADGKESPVHVIIKAKDEHGGDVSFKCPMIGATSMDMSTIDVSHVPEKYRHAGAEVTLMGDGITPNDFGGMYGTNPSETQTKLSPRIFMEYKESADVPKRPLDIAASANVWAA